MDSQTESVLRERLEEACANLGPQCQNDVLARLCEYHEKDQKDFTYQTCMKLRSPDFMAPETRTDTVAIAACALNVPYAICKDRTTANLKSVDSLAQIAFCGDVTDL